MLVKFTIINLVGSGGCFKLWQLLWQGGLDLQYLSSRFQRGKQWVEEFKESHHYFQTNDVGGLAPAHQELLKFQTGQGDDGDVFLDHFISCVFGIGLILCPWRDLDNQLPCPFQRCTLIIIDASLWPPRVLANI